MGLSTRLAMANRPKPVSNIYDGVGNAFTSFFQAPLAAAEAADERQKAEADIAFRGAQQRHADAATEQARANTALLYGKQKALDDQQQRGTLGGLLESAAMTRGVSRNMLPDLTYATENGALPQGKYQSPTAGADLGYFLKNGAMPPGAEESSAMGPSMPLPDALRPENVAKVMRDIGLMQNSLALGRGTVEDLAKAQDIYRSQDLGNDVLSGARTAGQVGQAQASKNGTKQIENIADTGEAFNIHTGERQRISNPLFTIFGDKANALIAKENAQAGASKASAASSYASAAKTRQDMELGAKGTPTMTDQGLLLVDPRGGTARAVIGPDGQPVGPKLKDIPPSVNTAIVSNMQNLAKAQAALDLVSGKNSGTATGDKNATGLKGYLPNGPLNYFDPKGVDARAAIADLGSMVLHERSGANVTASESPRLMPFIPLATDDPETIKKKLQRFIQIYRQETDFMGEQYSPSQGYKASPVLNRGGAPNTPDPLGLFSR